MVSRNGITKMLEVKIKMSEGFEHLLPEYATDGAAAMDCKAAITEPVTINPGDRVSISLAISTEIPEGYAAFLYPRSGLGAKKGMIPGNCVGVIDHDYRGEWSAVMYNTSKEAYTIKPGERIVQAVFKQFEKVKWIVTDTLSETKRGDGGYGSTGS